MHQNADQVFYSVGLGSLYGTSGPKNRTLHKTNTALSCVSIKGIPNSQISNLPNVSFLQVVVPVGQLLLTNLVSVVFATATPV